MRSLLDGLPLDVFKGLKTVGPIRVDVLLDGIQKFQDGGGIFRLAKNIRSLKRPTLQAICQGMGISTPDDVDRPGLVMGIMRRLEQVSFSCACLTWKCRK